MTKRDFLRARLPGIILAIIITSRFGSDGICRDYKSPFLNRQSTEFCSDSACSMIPWMWLISMKSETHCFIQ